MIIDMNYWTKVFRKILILIFSIILIYGAFKLSVFYMPFLIAFIIALLLEPIIKFLMKKTKLKRKTSSIIIFAISILIIIGLLVLGISTLISESANVLNNLNMYSEKAYNTIQNITNKVDVSQLKIPEELTQTLQKSAEGFLDTASVWIKTILTNVVTAITSIPTIGVYVVITLLALYFICTDKIYMLDQIEHHLPELWVKRLSKHIKDLIKALGCYLKAEATLVLISFVISVVGLYIIAIMGFNVRYPLIAALLIGFIDALPIFGSGTAMIPWAVIVAFNGDYKLAIAILILWIIMSVVRQFVEPRIVSHQIGIHPIFTLIAMYTGFKVIGVIGLLIGTIILIILKNIYGNVIDKGVMKAIFDRE